MGWACKLVSQSESRMYLSHRYDLVGQLISVVSSGGKPATIIFGVVYHPQGNQETLIKFYQPINFKYVIYL